MKQGGADMTISEASATQSLGEVGGFNAKKEKLKLSHSGRSPGSFFFRQDESTVRGFYPNKRYEAENCVSEECTTPSFEDGRGFLSMKRN